MKLFMQINPNIYDTCVNGIVSMRQKEKKKMQKSEEFWSKIEKICIKRSDEQKNWFYFDGENCN